MSVHQCPPIAFDLGELRFTLKPELDWHCREEHPGFRHDYAGPWEHPEDKVAREATTPRTPGF